ncbi:hypothetical protein ACFFU9_01960 [Mariniflexile ostreae]|uniref:Uncharacterized protein n=1 Tax=Mariniflexile ostreae TaxID=1520892 RepID=A0ABV5F7R0_9FLAO
MMPKHLLSILTLCFALITFQCEGDDANKTQEVEQAELKSLKSKIETLINTSICDKSTTCKYIAFGSKPCGGPWRYLLYTTSIDEEKLKTLIELYNTKEAAFNTKWGIVSDCAFLEPPVNITCENNICVPSY